MQFAARFDLQLDAETRAICRAIRLDDLPAERIWGEIEKLLLLAERPSMGFEVALDLSVMDQVFPEMLPLIGCSQEPEWHPEGDVWIHTLMVVDGTHDRIADLTARRRVTMMLGAVCHDLGKPATTAFIDGRIRSPITRRPASQPTTALLDRLNLHTIDGYDVRETGDRPRRESFETRDVAQGARPVGDGAFRRLAQKVDLELLARLAKADCLGRTGPFDCSAMDWFLERARALGVEHRPPPPLLLGRHLLDLGLRPGPRVGRILKQVYELQLDGQVTSLEAALDAAQGMLASASGAD